MLCTTPEQYARKTHAQLSPDLIAAQAEKRIARDTPTAFDTYLDMYAKGEVKIRFIGIQTNHGFFPELLYVGATKVQP